MSKKAHISAITSFNSNHTLYDQFRPSFHPTIVDKFLADLGLFDESPKTDKTVLELAAGTGKFTRNLANHGWKDNLVVVEPSQGMLDTFHKNFPDIKTHLGSSYALPLADQSVDAVVAAQAFHWFADEESLKEVKRVLKPNGKFGCIWNFDGSSVSQEPSVPKPNITYLLDESLEGTVETNESTDSMKLGKQLLGRSNWSQQVTNYFYSFDVGVPQYRLGKWKTLLSNNVVFKPIQYENYYYYDSPIAKESIYDYWLTRSYITSLSEEEKKKVQVRLNELLEKYVTKKDEFEKDGQVWLHRIMGTHSIVTEPK